MIAMLNRLGSRSQPLNFSFTIVISTPQYHEYPHDAKGGDCKPVAADSGDWAGSKGGHAIRDGPPLSRCSLG
jgi:hypothetical protein